MESILDKKHLKFAKRDIKLILLTVRDLTKDFSPNERMILVPLLTEKLIDVLVRDVWRIRIGKVNKK